MDSPLGAANDIPFLQGAASLKGLRNTAKDVHNRQYCCITGYKQNEDFGTIDQLPQASL